MSRQIDNTLLTKDHLFQVENIELEGCMPHTMNGAQVKHLTRSLYKIDYLGPSNYRSTLNKKLSIGLAQAEARDEAKRLASLIIEDEDEAPKPDITAQDALKDLLGDDEDAPEVPKAKKSKKEVTEVEPEAPADDDGMDLVG